MTNHFKRRVINGGNQSNCLFICVFSIMIEEVYAVENFKYIEMMKLIFYGKSMENNILFLLVTGPTQHQRTILCTQTSGRCLTP
jgi:hypothetical protein